MGRKGRPSWDIKHEKSSYNQKRIRRAEKEGSAVFFSDYDGLNAFLNRSADLDRYIRQRAEAIASSIEKMIAKAETSRERRMSGTMRVKRVIRGLYEPRIAYEVYSKDRSFGFWDVKAGGSIDDWAKAQEEGTTEEFIRKVWDDKWTSRAIRDNSRML